MPTWDDLDLDLWSVADLRRPGALTRVVNILDAFPEFKPDRVGSGEPVREPLESVAAALADKEAHFHRISDPQTAFARRESPKMALGWIRVASTGPNGEGASDSKLSRDGDRG